DRSGEPLTLFYVDLDHMKTINDAHGHAEGDRALRTVADLLRATFRLSDVIARMGGDEFCVLLTTGGRHDTHIAVDRLQVQVAAFNRSSPLPYDLSLSIGVAEYRPDEPCPIAELLQRADTAMYEQKRRRRPDGTGPGPGTAPLTV